MACTENVPPRKVMVPTNDSFKQNDLLTIYSYLKVILEQISSYLPPTQEDIPVQGQCMGNKLDPPVQVVSKVLREYTDLRATEDIRRHRQRPGVPGWLGSARGTQKGLELS